MASEDWNEVDVGELPEAIQHQYGQMKAIYRQYKAEKDVFEGKMQALYAGQMPEGRELKFGYNFGKLSVAVGEKREKKAAKPKQSLTDWLAEQQR
jgi:hypothetical protein